MPIFTYPDSWRLTLISGEFGGKFVSPPCVPARPEERGRINLNARSANLRWLGHAIHWEFSLVGVQSRVRAATLKKCLWNRNITWPARSIEAWGFRPRKC